MSETIETLTTMRNELGKMKRSMLQPINTLIESTCEESGKITFSKENQKRFFQLKSCIIILNEIIDDEGA